MTLYMPPSHLQSLLVDHLRLRQPSLKVVFLFSAPEGSAVVGEYGLPPLLAHHGVSNYVSRRRYTLPDNT